ncbi:4-hydroxy-tetrahydrodipicolinate synthase [Pseudofulvibacter geojedonensis]|uniref:4-hydroxy-tetrahydrodipicolinate synthase n=1 Tax=Pseudofulvibacter geojedonensis TaxID=1123758 RepID=A0ABW3HYW3_9FLAO
MNQFLGTGVALVTPFKKDLSIDFDALERIVNYNIDGGVEYLVVLGTTGESVVLTKEEKQQVVDCITRVNNKRLPMVLGIGGNNTKAVVEEIITTDLSDFDAILSVSPYYNKPSQEGIYQHFKAVAEACSKSVILYNVPGRTASNMTPETVTRLANDFKNVIAVKEAAGDIVQAMKMIQQTPDDFLVISGDDMIALPMTLAGGAGVISVIGEGLPKEFSEMIRLGLAGKAKEAYKLHYKVADSIDYIFEEGNPVGIKALFNKLGLCNPTVRLPLIEASGDLQKKINDFIENL